MVCYHHIKGNTIKKHESAHLRKKNTGKTNQKIHRPFNYRGWWEKRGKKEHKMQG